MATTPPRTQSLATGSGLRSRELKRMKANQMLLRRIQGVRSAYAAPERHWNGQQWIRNFERVSLSSIESSADDDSTSMSPTSRPAASMSLNRDLSLSKTHPHQQVKTRRSDVQAIQANVSIRQEMDYSDLLALDSDFEGNQSDESESNVASLQVKLPLLQIDSPSTLRIRSKSSQQSDLFLDTSPATTTTKHNLWELVLSRQKRAGLRSKRLLHVDIFIHPPRAGPEVAIRIRELKAQGSELCLNMKQSDLTDLISARQRIKELITKQHTSGLKRLGHSEAQGPKQLGGGRAPSDRNQTCMEFLEMLELDGDSVVLVV